MATILKSNVAITNTAREFQYYTNRGITDKAMADFLRGMENAGYELTDTEYSAVQNFKVNLESADIWSKVYEIYPLMGNSVQSAAVKLKSMGVSSTMSALGGLTDANLEFSGGKVLGKASSTTVNYQSNSPRFDTNLKYSDIPDRYIGFHVYCGNAPVGDTYFAQPVIGALFDKTDSTTKNIGVLAVNAFASLYKGQYLTTSNEPTAGFNNALGLLSYVSKPFVFDVSATDAIYRAGVKLQESIPKLLDSPTNVDPNATIGFFGQNISSVASTGTTGGYSGAVRFGCVTSGGLTDAEITTLNSEISILLNTLGKAA